MADTKKTSFTMTAHTDRVLERNKYQPNRSERINQLVGRYDMLISSERENVSDLANDAFLCFVVAEWVEAYPLQLGLNYIINQVYSERKFDRLEVPDEDEFKALMSKVEKLTLTQQVALVEIIESRFA